MIQIYSRENTVFSKNGDMVLFPEECVLKAQLNGIWKITMTHPIDYENRWKYIEPEAVIAVPTFMGNKQLFRISDKIEKNDYEISIAAYPIFWDSADEHMLVDVRPTGKTGQEALEIMTAGTKYSGKSNISAGNTAYFVRRNLLDAINGENEPTFIKTWGGEILYDNYEIIINDRVGGDYGYEVRYGKNMEDVRHVIDMSNVTTRIFPVAYNGHTLSSNYVDSKFVNNYAKIYAKELVFSDVKMRIDANEDDEKKGIIICDTQEELDVALAKKCEEQYAAGIDLMKLTIAVDMIDLSQTEDYKDFKDLEKVSLGDTVRCYNSRLNIATEQRVIEIEWDCIENTVKSVVLGDFEETFIEKTTSLANRVESTITEDGNVMAERIRGIIDGVKTQLKIQSTAAQKVEGRAFCVEDLDTSSDLYGCMVWGTQGLQISTKRTADDKDWDWTTALTAKGLMADIIIAGLLSDKTGRNWWNLDTGEFYLAATTIVGDSTVASKQNVADAKDAAYLYADNAVNELDSSLTMQNVFNRLTNNGQIQGLFMKDGQLYINAAYILTGILTDKTGNNRWDLENGIFSFTGNKMTVDSTKWKVNADGSQECSDMTITGGSLKAHADSEGETVVGVYGKNNYYGTEYSTEIRPDGVCMHNSEGRFTQLYEQGLFGGTYSGTSYHGESYFDLLNGVFWANGETSYCKSLNIGNNFTVGGTKSRVAPTENYNNRLLYCYETPSPMFGDLGEGKIDETGKCYVFIDEVFAETIDTECTYQIFLEAYGKGECYVTERCSSYFIVEGTAGLSFAWEVKAIQKEYDTRRLEEYELSVNENKDILSETYGYLSTLLYDAEMEVIGSE